VPGIKFATRNQLIKCAHMIAARISINGHCYFKTERAYKVLNYLFFPPEDVDANLVLSGTKTIPKFGMAKVYNMMLGDGSKIFADCILSFDEESNNKSLKFIYGYFVFIARSEIEVYFKEKNFCLCSKTVGVHDLKKTTVTRLTVQRLTKQAVIKGKVALLFPGQGVQNQNMFSNLKRRSFFQQLLSVVREVVDVDVLKLLEEDNPHLINRTDFAQLLVFLSSFSVFSLLKEDYPSILRQVVSCAGLSLGEFSALAASGVCDFKSTLDIVWARGKRMNEVLEDCSSSMISVIGIDQNSLKKIEEAVFS